MGQAQSHDELAGVVADLGSSNPTVQAAAAAKVTTLFVCSTSRQQISELSGAIPGLVKLLLSRKKSAAQVHAAEALWRLAASNDGNRQLILQRPGAITGLVQLLSSSSEEMQECAAGVLWSLAADLQHCPDNHGDRLWIGRSRIAVAGLVQLLGSSSVGVQQNAAGALCSLAECDTVNKQLIGQCEGAISNLVELLGSSSVGVQEKAASALCNLAAYDADNQQLIGQCEGAITGLMQLLGSSSAGVQECAARVLWSLTAGNDGNRQLIGRCEGAISGLVRLLRSSSAGVQECAAGVLWSLTAGNDSNRQLIGQCEGAISGLVQLLGSSSAGVQEKAATALCNLAAYDDLNKQLIGQCEGAISGLVQLLSSNSVKVQKSAAWALWNLTAGYNGNKQLIGQCEGAISGLVQLLGSSSADVQKEVAGALRSLTFGNDGNGQLIGQCEGAISGLVQLLGSSSAEVQEQAVGALLNLAVDKINAQLIGQCQGAIGGLVQLSGSSSAKVQKYAAGALHLLTRNDTNKQLVANCQGATSGRVKLLDNSNTGAQQAASAVLQILTESDSSTNDTGGGAIRPGDVECTTTETGPSSKVSIEALSGVGVTFLKAAASKAANIPVYGVYIAAILTGTAYIVDLAKYPTANKALVKVLMQRMEIIGGVLQDLVPQLQDKALKVSDCGHNSIVKALQQLNQAIDLARTLMDKFVEPGKRDVWSALQRFIASQQDNQDLVEVERQLCRSFNFLTHVLSAYTFLSIRYSTAKVESSMIAAAAAYKQDIADLEQNLSSIAGSVDQVNQQLQQHREQLQATVWPALQALGVHLGQLNVLDGKVDAVSTQISGIDQQVGAVAMQVSEIMSYLQQHMPCAAVSSSRPAAKPDMLILQENIQLVGSKPLGQGSFGTVYKAQYDHEDVAVKTFFLGGATDEDMKQVYREAVLLTKLNHPNIVRCYGIVTNPQGEGDHATRNLHGSLVMEKCEMDLAVFLHHHSAQLSLLHKVGIGLGISYGMRFLHHGCGGLAPVVHGDLKPSNVLMNLDTESKPRQVKVCDFGISRTCQVSSTLSHATPNRSFGSLQWLAPEACEALIEEGVNQATTAMDVYAFGVVLFELVTGQKPYSNKGMAHLHVRVANGARPGAKDWLAQQLEQHTCSCMEHDFLKRVVALMESCWAQQPSDRPCFKAIVDQLKGEVKALSI